MGEEGRGSVRLSLGSIFNSNSLRGSWRGLGSRPVPV